MESSNRPKDLSIAIGESSPLFEYWESSQNQIDEEKRLKKASNKFPAAVLFKQEPYKWEMLYQSIIREIERGDINSLKGLKLLINMLTEEEQNKLIESFLKKGIFNEELAEKLKEDSEKATTKKDPARFLRILFAIFTNPYCIQMKGKKVHIYEKIGSIFYSLRTLI